MAILKKILKLAFNKSWTVWFAWAVEGATWLISAGIIPELWQEPAGHALALAIFALRIKTNKALSDR